MKSIKFAVLMAFLLFLVSNLASAYYCFGYAVKEDGKSGYYYYTLNKKTLKEAEEAVSRALKGQGYKEDQITLDSGSTKGFYAILSIRDSEGNLSFETGYNVSDPQNAYWARYQELKKEGCKIEVKFGYDMEEKVGEGVKKK